MKTSALTVALVVSSIALRASAGPPAPPAQHPAGIETPSGLVGHVEVPLRHTRHGYIGGHLMGLAALAQSTDYDSGYLGRFGGGIGLFGGIRLGPYLALEGNWTFSLHDGAWGAASPAGGQGVRIESLYIMTATADAKIYMPSRGPMEPYIQGGLGFALTGAIHLPGDAERPQDDLSAKGLLFNVGGGLDLWATRHICMGGRVLFRGLALGEPEVKPMAVAARNFISTVTVDAYVSIHF